MKYFTDAFAPDFLAFLMAGMPSAHGDLETGNLRVCIGDLTPAEHAHAVASVNVLAMTMYNHYIGPIDSDKKSTNKKKKKKNKNKRKNKHSQLQDHAEPIRSEDNDDEEHGTLLIPIPTFEDDADECILRVNTPDTQENGAMLIPVPANTCEDGATLLMPATQAAHIPSEQPMSYAYFHKLVSLIYLTWLTRPGYVKKNCQQTVDTGKDLTKALNHIFNVDKNTRDGILSLIFNQMIAECKGRQADISRLASQLCKVGQIPVKKYGELLRHLVLLVFGAQIFLDNKYSVVPTIQEYTTPCHCRDA
jgi:hypothetical protein